MKEAICTCVDVGCFSLVVMTCSKRTVHLCIDVFGGSDMLQMYSIHVC